MSSRLIGLLSLILIASPACKQAPKGGSDNHFRVNLGTEPPSLDWSLATDHVSFNVIANLMVGLTEFNKELKPAPVVAKSWDVLDGGKKLVFHLRDDVAWSEDGKHVVFVSTSRDHKQENIRIADCETGEVKDIFKKYRRMVHAPVRLMQPNAVIGRYGRVGEDGG